MTHPKATKERANKLFIRFKTPLSPQSLNSLSSDASFTGKFSNVDIIKHNDNVVAMRLLDNSNIDYSLNIERIEAFSIFQKDSFVKKQLEFFARDILSRFGRNTKDYLLDDTVRHDIIESDLNKLIDPALFKGLEKAFLRKGYDNPEVISIKIFARKKGEISTSVQFHYPSSKFQEDNRAVIEANNELLKDILSLIK